MRLHRLGNFGIGFIISVELEAPVEPDSFHGKSELLSLEVLEGFILWPMPLYVFRSHFGDCMFRESSVACPFICIEP
jgi:hypothetical protein